MTKKKYICASPRTKQAWVCIGINREEEIETWVKTEEFSKQISHFVIRLEYKLEAKCLISGFVVID